MKKDAAARHICSESPLRSTFLTKSNIYSIMKVNQHIQKQWDSLLEIVTKYLFRFSSKVETPVFSSVDRVRLAKVEEVRIDSNTVACQVVVEADPQSHFASGPDWICPRILSDTAIGSLIPSSGSSFPWT